MSTPTRTSRPAPPRLPLPSGRAARAREWLRVRGRRLRSAPGWWWPWGAVVVTLLVAGVAGWLLLFSPATAVRSVVVVGEDQIGEAAVLEAAAVELGIPLLRLDVDGVDRRVRDLDAVAEVTVSREWPDTVRIEVVERRALGVIRTERGFGLLGSDGVVYREVGGPQPGLPFLDQTEGDAATDPSAAAALQVAVALPPQVSRRVATVTAASPDQVVLRLRGGATVRWGSAVGTARKAEVLLKLLPEQARTYDVSAPEAPVTIG